MGSVLPGPRAAVPSAVRVPNGPRLRDDASVNDDSLQVSAGDADDLSPREKAVREDLGTEYYALLDVVAGFDGRSITVKGWSVTLSLAALGLGFQQQHYALFGLAALTSVAFWVLDLTLKGHQMRFYPRMRDIEVAAHKLNTVNLPGLGDTSAPRIDSSWNDPRLKHRDSPPERRNVAKLTSARLRRPFFAQVMFPHVLATLLGVALFVAALLDAPGLDTLKP